MKFSTLSTFFSFLSFSLEVNAFKTGNICPFVPSSSFRMPSTRFMAMGNELQEMDQTVIKQKVPSSSTDLNSGTVGFKLPIAVGVGMDERFPMFPDDQQLSIESEKLSNVETSFYKHSLLMDLSSKDMGSFDKLEKIRHGSIVGLLPTELFSNEMDPQSVNFHAGGLFKDWSDSLE